RLVHVLAEGVVRVDDLPVGVTVLGDRLAGAVGQLVGVVGVVERVGVALRARELGACRADVEVQFLVAVGLLGHGQRGGGGRHVQDDVGALALIHLLGLGVGDVRLVLVVGGDDLDGV